VQPLPADNYFALFDLPIAFILDKGKLSSRYRNLMQNLHPDRYAHSLEKERAIAVQTTSRINDAYNILREPLKRAVYLLELNGVDYANVTHTVNDAEFLMEQMELRERLAAVKSADDPHGELSNLLENVKKCISSIETTLSGLFDSGNESDLEQATNTVVKMQFFTRLYQQIEEQEEEMIL
jgi:molecular chaperone HscB